MDNPKIKVYIKNKGNLIANANVTLETVEFGQITIKGFQIWRSRNYNQRLSEAINITPPTRQGYGFPTLVFFESKNKWYELELIIYETFNLKRNERANEELTDKDMDEISEGRYR